MPDTRETPTERVAGEVRAEMARQRRRKADLAALLGITPMSLSRRLNAEASFSIDELVTVADWLGVPLEQFTAAAAS